MGGFAHANGEMLVGENDCVEGIRNVGFCSAPCSVRRVGCGDGAYTGCVGRWRVGGQRWSPSENVRGVLRAVQRAGTPMGIPHGALQSAAVGAATTPIGCKMGDGGARPRHRLQKGGMGDGRS